MVGAKMGRKLLRIAKSKTVKLQKVSPPVVEPVAGDLPDAASEGVSEPSMPETAREIPGTPSEAAPLVAAAAQPVMEDKACRTEDEPLEADDASSDDTLLLQEEMSSAEYQEDSQTSSLEGTEEALVGHDSQASDEVGSLSEPTPRVEDPRDQARKRPGEELEVSDEVGPPKKVMSEVNSEASSIKTVGCEE